MLMNVGMWVVRQGQSETIQRIGVAGERTGVGGRFSTYMLDSRRTFIAHGRMLSTISPTSKNNETYRCARRNSTIPSTSFKWGVVRKTPKTPPAW